MNTFLKYLSIFSIGILFLFSSGWAQESYLSSPEEVGMSSERLSRIESHFQSYLDENKFAGMQTLVARKGKIIHFESMGFADKESEKKMDESAIFRIYSMSKPITSVAIMMLYEEGKLQLDDPVHKYIPSFKKMTAVVKDDKSGETEKLKNPMRIVDLLTHTSGLGYGWGKGTYVDSVYRATGFWFEQTMMGFADKVATMPLYFQPGTAWRYGISTDILGIIVEVVSGQSFDVYLKENIFGPLGMEDTFFEVPQEKFDRFTTCYKPKLMGGIDVQDHPSKSRFAKTVTMFSGGGGLLSTSEDYFKFCQMLLNGGELNGKRLLSPKSIELMTQVHTEGIEHAGGPVVHPTDAFGFGLGFSVTKNLAATNNLGSVGTYGWGGAAGTYFRIDPKEELIIIQMIQLMPYAHLNHQREFHSLVYQAIVD
ncbi:MAG: serine hydrolase domain-containing protein [Bacteroidota bacterium]